MKEVVVVTGGGGFIGHHLVESLIKDHHVVVLDNFSRGTFERLANFENKATILSCDITDFDDLEGCLDGYEVKKIIHLAAINGTGNFYKIPVQIMDVGVLGCFNILKYAKRHNVLKVVLASSAEVYQECTEVPTPEDVPLIIPNVKNPRFSYGLSKIYTEYYSYHFGLEHDLNVSIFRPHNVFGPNMGLQHVIPQFIMEFLNQVDQSSEVVVNAKGSLDAIRAFCYVDDIVSGIQLLADHNKGVNVYNLGNTQRISMSDLVDEIADIMGCKYSISQKSNEHIGGTMLRCPDITKAENLGFTCTTSLTSGLEKTINWYKNNLGKLSKITNSTY
jgi:nucleoside-diphosphate-sugar epimerase